MRTSYAMHYAQASNAKQRDNIKQHTISKPRSAYYPANIYDHMHCTQATNKRWYQAAVDMIQTYMHKQGMIQWNNLITQLNKLMISFYSCYCKWYPIFTMFMIKMDKPWKQTSFKWRPSLFSLNQSISRPPTPEHALHQMFWPERQNSSIKPANTCIVLLF